MLGILSLVFLDEHDPYNHSNYYSSYETYSKVFRSDYDKDLLKISNSSVL